MKLKSWILVPALFLCATAWGVSRVGTGKAWNEEVGFETSVAPVFNRYSILRNDNLRFDGPSRFENGRWGDPALAMILLLQNEQPQWVGKHDRLEFRLHYQLRGWEVIVHNDPCIEALKKRSGDTVNYLLSWGNGRGVLLVGPGTNEKYVDQMFADLKLFPGVCEWR